MRGYRKHNQHRRQSIGGPFLQIVLAISLLKETLQMPMNVDSAIGLRKWLIDGGAYLNPKVQIDFFPGLGYGLRSTESIAPEEMICAIPESQCLHSHGKFAIENITTKLAVELKKGKESFYYPFLCTLPDDPFFVPAMWNDKKIIDSDLNGTQMEKDIKNMYFNWCADAKKYVLLENSIDSASPNNHVNSISESDWLWARATMQARGFSFRKNMNLMNLNKNDEKNSDTIADANHDNGKEKMQEIVDIVSFIPFITLSNHDDDLGGRTTMGNGDTFSHTSYTFQTKKKIDKDKQIFNFYGELSFQQKFLSFGWVDRFPILSPEGFCITAFDIPLPLPTTSSISSNVLELEIKSNILLASEVASRKLMEKKGKVIGGKENGINSQQMISNDLSLKITLLKFDIRSMIQKVEEKGLKKIEIISLIHDILIEKKKNLIVGLNIKSIDRNANDDIHVDANHGISLSTDEAKNSQQNKNKNPIEMKKNTKLQQKTKSKENLKKIQNLADVSKEIESDGQYIRRTELEAIELLLTYLPSC